MADAFLNLEELMDLTGWSARTVQQRVKAGELRWRQLKGRGRNGRPGREYSLLSLPPDLQIKFLRRNRNDSPEMASCSEPNGGQLVLFGANQSGAGSSRLPVHEDHYKQIEVRTAAINPLVEYLKLAGGAEKKQWLRNSSFAASNADELAQEIGRAHGGRATIWRWYKVYKERGAQALFDGPRKDKGESRWFSRYPEAAVFAAYVYLEQRQSVTCAWEAIKRDAPSLGVPVADLPSYETVRVALQSIPPTLRILAREGAAKYREMCAPYVSRSYTEHANLIWVSDHALFDVEVFNDCFPEQPYGAPIRLRLTAILDFKSRFVVGHSFAWEGSSRSIGTALRNAILRHGPCENFYCDNGRDYLKVAKGAIPGYLRESDLAPTGWAAREMVKIEEMGILARCGISVTHCIVRHPQSKHVERFFRTMHERFDRKWPTYTAGRSDLRPDLTEMAMAAHRKLLRHGEVNQSQHPRASLFIGAFQTWLDEYHSAVHRGRGMDGRTPAQVFVDERNPQQRPAPEPDLLAMMLLERETRLVQEGSVRIAKRRYVGYDGHSYDQMHRLNRTNVIVAFDLNDVESVAILDEDGEFLTWAKAEQFVEQSATAAPVIAASMQVRRHLEKKDRATLRGITLVARANGAKSEVEHLAETVWLTPAVGDNITHSTPRTRPDVNAAASMTPAEAARMFLGSLRKDPQ